MTDMKARPGHLARRFQQIAVAIFHAEVEKVGSDLTPVQYAALATLRGNPGIDQATLAAAIAYDRPTITGVIDRLEQKGLITRRVSDRDRRARVLQITEAGEAELDRIEPAVDAAQHVILRGLDADEAAVFLRLLHKAIDATADLGRVLHRDPPGTGAVD